MKRSPEVELGSENSVFIFVTQNTLFGKHMTQNTLFYGFYVDGSKIITYAIGEHDPGSAQKGRKSSQMKSPGSKDAEVKMSVREGFRRLLTKVVF